MGSLSNYAENKVTGLLFGGTAYSAPATLYFALVTTAPTDGSPGSEPSTGNWTNYARVAVTNNTTNFTAPTTGSTSNNAAISFGTAAVTGSDVSINGIHVYDASSGGNLIAHAALGSTKTVSNGDAIEIAIGAFTISCD